MDKSRYGTAAGEWLMRFKVPRRLRAWSRRAIIQEEQKTKKKKSRKRRNVGNDSFQTLLSLQVVVVKVVMPSTVLAAARAQEIGAS